jgi:phosphatidylglycerophosphatase C
MPTTDPTGSQATVIFDLDHTLVPGDSFAAFNRELLLDAWWRIGLAMLAVPAIAALWSFSATRTRAGSILLWLGTVARSGDLRTRMDEFVIRHFSDGSRICSRAVEQARLHCQRGDRVIVVTGAAELLARRVCVQIGLDSVEIVGSTLRDWMGGWVAGEHCTGERKVKMLADRKVMEPWDCAYTDSASDLPLLTRARRRILVNPQTRARRLLSNALGDSLEVVSWREDGVNDQ